jgi:hypothetical protein
LLEKHPLKDNATLDTRLQQYIEKMKLADDAKKVRKEIKAAQSLILQEDLKARRKVLTRLGYIDADEMVTTKVCNGFKRSIAVLKCIYINNVLFSRRVEWQQSYLWAKNWCWRRSSLMGATMT